VIKRITLQSEETDHIQTMIRGDCVQSSIFWTIKICWIQIQYLQYLKESKNICITSYFTLMLPTYLMNRTDLVGFINASLNGEYSWRDCYRDTSSYLLFRCIIEW
jgi:hypothetical protein